MGFKLGANRENYAVKGEIKTKMRFGKESGGDASVPGTPIIRTKLAKGVNGEANMDGSIYISDKLEPGSAQERQTIMHEMRHATDLRIGSLEYGDDYIKYKGETFPRKTIKRMDMILVDGEWKQAGDTTFPWEMDANNGNHQ